ncbi:transcriptional regulator [Pullulanibacillus camelliae]|uniref:Transcriptional regulator n=1 Tax=Pullulanibacillus camelliae TaxID=1707096 RepID=A0A8J2VMF0_9BACL|nr:MarR family transcriptional regulator [Pullulanibacillus camelliae]GGE32429.1 transcriptional regulator [Pullulanibacillus camelliae]
MQKERLDELVKRYFEVSFMVHRRGESLIHQQISEHLTHDQHFVLNYIHKKQTVTSSELAEMLNVKKSAITALINRLEEKGLIERERQHNDRRVVHLSLSSKGRQLSEECDQKVNELVADLITRFNDQEISQFMQTYEKIALFLDEALRKEKGVE